MADDRGSRRAALKTFAWCIAGAAALWRFLTPLARVNGSRPRISVPAEDVPADGALVLPEEGVAIVRTGLELHAVDLACTHLGCTVRASAEGFACPCHGSRFDCRGGRVSGPAALALRTRATQVENGFVHVGEVEAT